jgi:DNA polymerase
VFVGEGPGFNEDREGRPFVGRAGGLLVKLLGSVGWQRNDVFITNVVKCRPPDNRDPEPDEIAACAPFLRRQLEVLDPALVVTLGRFSMGTFMPGARISGVHGTMKPVDPATGASDALAYAMYHPAAALRSTEVEQTSYRDMAGVPAALLKSRERRDRHAAERAVPTPADADLTEPTTSDVGVSEPTPATADIEGAEPTLMQAAPEPAVKPVASDPTAEPSVAPATSDATPVSDPTSPSDAAIDLSALSAQPVPSAEPAPQLTLFSA